MEYIWPPSCSQSTLSYVISEDAGVYLGLVVVKNRTKRFGGWGVGMGNNQGSKIISQLSMLFLSDFLSQNQIKPHLIQLAHLTHSFLTAHAVQEFFPTFPFAYHPSIWFLLYHVKAGRSYNFKVVLRARCQTDRRQQGMSLPCYFPQ